MELLKEIVERHIGLTLKECEKGIYLQGPIKFNDEWTHITIHCPDYPSLKNTQLKIQCQHKYKTISSKHFNEFQSIIELFDNMPKLLCENSDETENDHTFTQRAQKEDLLDEIIALFSPKDYEIYLNKDCSRVSFTKFFQFDNHFLELDLPTLSIVKSSLPSCINWNTIFSKCNDLSNILQRFIAVLEDLQPFYENLAVIDELCYVVKPTKPTSKDNYRIFTLKERVFLKLIFIDPFAPYASMCISIIGPTNDVQHLRHIYSEGLRNWDSELDVHKNLLRIFDLCFFPMPPTAEKGAHQFCNICYSYELIEGEIPIVSCDNPHCNLIYHAACLREWFQTLIDGQTFLNVSMGGCPFCKTKLSASFQELLN